MSGGVKPSFCGRRMMGEKRIANGDAPEVEADDGRASRVERIDHFEASATEVEVESGGAAGRELACGEGDESTFGMTGEKSDLLP